MTTLPTTIILTLSLIATISAVTGQNFNITDILSDFPEYSAYNKYLTQTKLNDEINTRQTLTVLVINNSTVTKFLENQPLSVVKTVLSIHVLLDYFDLPKLLSIGDGSTTSTTLYQTTGKAAGRSGFVNITDLVGNKIGFGSGEGSRLESLYSKSVKLLPYNLSVLEINSPIIPPGILMTSGKPPPAVTINITSVFEKVGCKTFARLVSETGVFKVYEGAERNGLTIFAPMDAAFKVSGLNLGKLNNAEFISLLLYHAIPGYYPEDSLKNEVDPVSTLASNEIEKFFVSIRSNGDSATLSSGIDDSRVESMVFDSVPICIFRIYTVLLPSNLFTKSPLSAPGPILTQTSTPVEPPVEPAPESESAPTPRSIATSPSPVGTTSPTVSPPAPADRSTDPSTLSPDGVPAPAEGPTADMGDTKTSGGVRAPMMFLALVMVLISGFIVA